GRPGRPRLARGGRRRRRGELRRCPRAPGRSRPGRLGAGAGRGRPRARARARRLRRPGRAGRRRLPRGPAVRWLAGLAVAATAAAPAGVIDHGRRAHRVIALTFDADMTRPMLAQLRSGKVKSWYDRRIVSYLRATGTPATIFLTGLWTREYPAAVRSL